MYCMSSSPATCAQSVVEATTNAAYLLSLDWRLAAGYQQLASRESLRRKLKAATKDPAFGLVIGTVSELRGQLAATTVRVRSLEEQVASFRVVAEYELLQARADEIDAHMPLYVCVVCALKPNIVNGVSEEWGVFAAVHLDGVEAGVSGLSGDGGSVGAVAGALGDEPARSECPPSFARAVGA